MRFREMIVSALVFVFISGVFAFAADTDSTIAPSPRMLDGLSPEAAMDLANTWGLSSDENKVNIWTTSREIHFVFPDGSKRIVALPPDRMVVSVAPYIIKTHPCKQHTPSGCQGELANTPVELRAVTADGKVILEERTVRKGKRSCVQLGRAIFFSATPVDEYVAIALVAVNRQHLHHETMRFIAALTKAARGMSMIL